MEFGRRAGWSESSRLFSFWLECDGAWAYCPAFVRCARHRRPRSLAAAAAARQPPRQPRRRPPSRLPSARRPCASSPVARITTPVLVFPVLYTRVTVSRVRRPTGSPAPAAAAATVELRGPPDRAYCQRLGDGRGHYHGHRDQPARGRVELVREWPGDVREWWWRGDQWRHGQCQRALAAASLDGTGTGTIAFSDDAGGTCTATTFTWVIYQ